jgi:hypothetical protein
VCCNATSSPRVRITAGPLDVGTQIVTADRDAIRVTIGPVEVDDGNDRGNRPLGRDSHLTPPQMR